ncbi:lectin subunit alpha-like [Atheta coriaria]|uniref:lectin subunit alpha-like n=1 Tax=Dalotia coriaria TaxID=877792 RepID=UPI0031F3AB45
MQLPKIVYPAAYNWLQSPPAQNKLILKTCLKDQLNWHLAFQDCEARGLQMATVNDRNEHYDLKMAVIKTNTVEDWTWVAGTDLPIFRNFSWITNGRPVPFWLWYPQEPNNNGGNERCLHYRNSLGEPKWNDLDCNRQLFYACEDKQTTCATAVA